MGVYIKGMKMPRSCYNCKLDLRTDICLAFLKWKGEHPYSIKRNDRLPDCPLVEVPEPHGRLIDADATLQKYCDEFCKRKPSCEEDCIIYDLMHMTQTVIEAEVD